MSVVDRALELARDAVDGVTRIATALERIAAAAERQAGSARAAKTISRSRPRSPAPVSDFDAKRAREIAKASGFRVLE